MAFAELTHARSLSARRKDGLRTHVVDNINGAFGFVAARIYRRRGRRFDSLASGRGRSDPDSAVDYWTTRRSLTRALITFSGGPLPSQWVGSSPPLNEGD